MADPRLVAEFDSVAALERAIDALHAYDRDRLEAYAPHGLPELEEKLGIRRSRIPWLAFAAGATGAVFAFGLMTYLTAYNYPLDVGARPLWSIPAFVPITFETTILAAALTSFAAWLYTTRLPTPDHPLLGLEGFTSVSIDKFWLSVRLPPDDLAGTAAANSMHDAGALRVVLVPEEQSWDV